MKTSEIIGGALLLAAGWWLIQRLKEARGVLPGMMHLPTSALPAGAQVYADGTIRIPGPYGSGPLSGEQIYDPKTGDWMIS